MMKKERVYTVTDLPLLRAEIEVFPKPKKKRTMWSHFAETEGKVLEDGTVVLTLPIIQSNNTEPRTNIYATAKYKDFWGVTAYNAWLLAGKPFLPKAVLVLKFYFPDHRARDFTNYSGNYGVKGILDGLKEHLFPDDHSGYLTLGGVTFHWDKEHPRMELHFKQIRNEMEEVLGL